MNVENVRIVLVEPSHPGNIGACARAMKNMGLQRLVLVSPVRYPHAEAKARAAGADDLLEAAHVVQDLEAALADCRLVIGASARWRNLASPGLSPRECAARIAEASAYGPAALVFGRESSGLTNDELDRCNFLVHIPTNPAFSSLNLAAAVLVLAYELCMSEPQTRPARLGNSASLPAPAEEMARFYEHLEQVLLETGFLDPANPRHLMRRLRRLFNRARPDQNEINILRGVLSAVQGRKRPRRG